MGLMGTVPRSAFVAVACLAFALDPARGRAELVTCRHPSDTTRIAEALERIRSSVDPCGESPQVLQVLEALERCTTARYEICTTAHSIRNLFDRPHDESQPGTITWNPALATELESVCDGDPARPVMRDPTASLLHEIVHAAHDCEGLSPGEHELEAIRIENIYRRAKGLCQRLRYGDDMLPREAVKPCAFGACACGAPAPPATVPARGLRAAVGTTRHGADSALREQERAPECREPLLWSRARPEKSARVSGRR